MGHTKVGGFMNSMTSRCLRYRIRYFSQRYSIFSWYDEGVYMTDDAWFGVTPEPVAKYVKLVLESSVRGSP